MRRFISTRVLVPAVTALAAAACDAPMIPTDPVRPETTSAAATAPLSQLDRQERLAQRLAVALGQAGRRQALSARLRQATGVEQKVHFQLLLGSEAGSWRRALAEGGSGGEAALTAELADLGPLEVYLPVPEHRSRWAGGADLLVATAVEDGAPPAAFDVTGRRFMLDPARPPERPVLALVPAEQSFSASGDIFCLDCGGGGSSALTAPGLYMTYAAFTSTYEGWLKGNPEFETHVLGQEGGTSSLTPYQCAGERAGGAYTYDQNAKTWSGSVMLFSQAQLDAY
ncbi:MAG TPA: hypothetical protein VF862_10655, partial [Gemmatimonadales bacterium]